MYASGTKYVTNVAKKYVGIILRMTEDLYMRTAQRQSQSNTICLDTDMTRKICSNCSSQIDWENCDGGICDVCDKIFCDECIDYKNCLQEPTNHDVICFKCAASKCMKCGDIFYSNTGLKIHICDEVMEN